MQCVSRSTISSSRNSVKLIDWRWHFFCLRLWIIGCSMWQIRCRDKCFPTVKISKHLWCTWRQEERCDENIGNEFTMVTLCLRAPRSFHSQMLRTFFVHVTPDHIFIHFIWAPQRITLHWNDPSAFHSWRDGRTREYAKNGHRIVWTICGLKLGQRLKVQFAWCASRLRFEHQFNKIRQMQFV